MDPHLANEETRRVWDGNAAFWDSRMGEGNDFVEVLLWPSIVRLLQLRPGERVLDAACGNGLTSRRMAALGVQVLAFDFSEAMIAHAIERTQPSEYAGRIEYRVLDATDEPALLALGTRRFDAALCNMALFDIAEIAPLMRALARLLVPGGRFVFSVVHPCFNSGHVVHIGEQEDRGGEIVERFALKVYSYLTEETMRAAAMRGQPRPQLLFHRPLQALLGPVFEAGFVIDALEERAFPPDHPQGGHPLSWGGHFSEIPPVMVVRVRNVRRET
jgi:SAM-dependent methyltransferase